MKNILFATLLLLSLGCTIPIKSIPDYDVSYDNLFRPDVSSGKVNLWQLNGDQSKLNRKSSLSFQSGSGSGANQITVNSDLRYQVMEGMGAALTDTSSSLIYHHSDRDGIMESLFSREKGIGISFVRIALGPSDYSLGSYCYQETRESVFSLDHDRSEIIPLLKQACQINPDLQIMGSPWSAPGWMKEGGTGDLGLIGGTLKSDCYDDYAAYLYKILAAYREEGLELHSFTLQNEPLHDSAGYPCMYMSPSDQVRLIGELLPLMEGGGMNSKILVYDHNWVESPFSSTDLYPRHVFDSLTRTEREKIGGSAWHAYGGEPSVMTACHDQIPSWDIYFTEITGGNWSTSFPSNLRWNFEKIFIGAPRNWAKTALLWNLVLDENGGPNIRPTPADPSEICRGVLTIDSTGKVNKEVEYYILGQTARFLYPGAVRIQSTEVSGDLKSVAYQNTDGSIVLIVLNNTWTNPITFTVNVQGKHFTHTLPVESAATFVW